MVDSVNESPRLASRASLRAATFIDPDTGARLKKQFTLHDGVDSEDQPTADGETTESSPLLNNGGQTSRLRSHVRTFLDAGRKLQNATNKVKDMLLSETGKGVFKCALAYLLGSLATFIPGLRNLFGRSDTKHLVATITVYFHPARSLGSMLEALILASGAFLYTAVVSIVSMTVASFFEDSVHMIGLGHVIILILFVGGGLGSIAWFKLRQGNPLVNIACSLTALSLITILTKEGAVQQGEYSFVKISQILRMLIGGIIATTLVSFLIFPISGRRNLKQNMVEVNDTLSDMLAMITSSFISGDEAELEDLALKSVTARHRKGFAALSQNLKESRYEHYLFGTERLAWHEARLSDCIQRITQSIGGLRSTAAMQFVVIKQPQTNALGQANMRNLASNSSIASTPSYTTASERRLSGSVQTGVANIDEILSGTFQPTSSLGDRPFRTPCQIFDLFMDHLGPSMRSLAYTLKEILDDLPFDPQQNYAVSVNPKFKVSLDRALELYRDARKEALKAVYDKKELDRSRPLDVEADWEEAAACCGHFSFSLIEVAEEIRTYLAILDEMQLELEEKVSGRSWSWLKIWKSSGSPADQDDDDSAHAVARNKANDIDFELRHRDKRRGATARQLDHGSSWKEVKRFYFRALHRKLEFFRRDDIKYAIKVGFGAVLYALPSFIPATRPFYSHWRGEWGLLSYMLVCSMTIGASNTTGYSRILGTGLGAVLACTAWKISDGHPVVLAFFGFCMAYWTAYIIVGKGKGPMGRFIMLTYNLSCLYAYSLSVQDEDHDDDEEDRAKDPLIISIATHRFVAVISGCIWGLVVTRLVWPISARQKLKEGLALLWLRMGLIWKRDPLSVLTEGEIPNSYMNLREEFKLQRYVTELQGLIDSSKSEFELRGPFPDKVYGQILTSTAQMLDAFHAINIVISKDLNASPGEEALLKATLAERTQLCSRISHLFSVLASSMKLEFPLATDALPSIDHTRDRLLARIFAYRKTNAEQEQTSDEDFGILYTYALVTGQLAVEVERTLKQVESLFGVLDEEALKLR